MFKPFFFLLKEIKCKGTKRNKNCYDDLNTCQRKLKIIVLVIIKRRYKLLYYVFKRMTMMIQIIGKNEETERK